MSMPHTTVADAVIAACARIAPTWPLDRMIAVNPYWGFVGQPIEDAAAELAAMTGTTLLMRRSWFRAQWRAGRFAARHLDLAHVLAGDGATGTPELITLLHAATTADDDAPLPRALVTDVADIGRDLAHAMSWSEFVTRHISQACAAYFDEGQAQWGPARDEGLWSCWRALAMHDGSPRLLMALHGFREAAAALPNNPHVLIAEALDALNVAPAHREEYLTALLLSVNGWASACAYRRWEARLAKHDDEQIVHLLAVRLAWELLLYRLANPAALPQAWQNAQRAWPTAKSEMVNAQQQDWLLQRALEAAYQEDTVRRLSEAPRSAPASAPTAQAVFCIDVRSELFRRALESAAPSVQTLGFAGFFGLPVAYAPISGAPRAQLPGLLSPSMHIVDVDQQTRARVVANGSRPWASTVKELGTLAGSAFSFVESAGLGWAAALVRDGFGRGERTGDVLRETMPTQSAVVPELSTFAATGALVDLSSRVSLAAGVLRAMNLARDFAPLVALIGHGASTQNNPQAAGLHCGACGGQKGEVNARALASLLNDEQVRAGLKAEGIDLKDTLFIGGLHDTTTDDVHLYEGDVSVWVQRKSLLAFREQLDTAGRIARRERAPSLGLGDMPDAKLDDAIRARAADWSEVRPEWGLAGNAAFIVAPRARTRGVNLAGRSFLHEYTWQDDTGYAVLELIMTAPMVVTHWINMQYHASTVDPLRYGSGNKVLHNVVGGHIGVMEGAGGDLRIGLAWQSVHDGTRERHEPLRLSVFIDAPADAIDGIIAKHAVVRDLVNNGWLFLHRFADDGAVHRRVGNTWAPVQVAEAGVR